MQLDSPKKKAKQNIDSIMRKRFEHQLKLGYLLIEDTKIPTTKRSGALPELCAALKEIFITPKWNEKVFKILERKIYPENNKTGRPGMELWNTFNYFQIGDSNHTKNKN